MPGVVIYVKDLAGLTTFYAAVTGLELTHTQPGHSELGPDVVLVKIPNRIADRIATAMPPARREDTAIKPVFEVADLDHVRQRMKDFGGALNPVDREWQFGDWTVCDGHDPEGNMIQFRTRSY